MMINSYIKTSGRNINRYKLFSGINILGLAVSMSLGLVLIAFIQQLTNFDQFHEKKDRIYRLVTTTRDMDLATTSVVAGKRIQETFASVEQVTLLRRGFGGDATLPGKVIPVSGFWADNSFLSVFTFPLIRGDFSTALKEPYSVVVTEQTALKLFGKPDVLGQSIAFDTAHYVITGVLKDLPAQSHIRFDLLISFSTVELQKPDTDGGFMSWGSCFMNMVYLVLPEGIHPDALQSSLDRLCATENKTIQDGDIHLSLQPVTDIVLGRSLVNQTGPVMNMAAVSVLGVMAFIVILSAVFNYSNLSIARALRRSREVGIRKVVGATKAHVAYQFMTESVVICLIALLFASVLFVILREQFLNLHPFLRMFGTLPVDAATIAWFILLALAIGILAGAMPAWFFSRIHAARVLKDASSLQLFRHLTVRKALIVVQYMFSLVFITATTIGYTQYKGMLDFDLGFSTENIMNISLQGNQADQVIKEIKAVAGVDEVSQSLLVMSLGSNYNRRFKYEKTGYSSDVWVNYIDEHFLPLHRFKLVAGKNFQSRSQHSTESEAIVNEMLLKRFHIGGDDPVRSIGEEISIDGQRLTIVGVVKDFHYETLEDKIEPVVLQHFTNASNGYLNAKIVTSDWGTTRQLIDQAWKKIDDVHPLQATLYDDQLEQAYSPFRMMLKVIGFLAFLTILISSMGLFGMVVYTTETRRKEISIRKVLGASEAKLVFLLGKGFFVLLGIAAAVAIPATYQFFSAVILSQWAYHESIGIVEIVVSLSIVIGIALAMIASQSFTIARANPAETLKEQ